MRFPYLSAEVGTQHDHSSLSDTRLRGRARVLAQIVWVGVVVLALGLFSAAMPMTYRRLSAPPAAVQTCASRFHFILHESKDHRGG